MIQCRVRLTKLSVREVVGGINMFHTMFQGLKLLDTVPSPAVTLHGLLECQYPAGGWGETCNGIIQETFYGVGHISGAILFANILLPDSVTKQWVHQEEETIWGMRQTFPSQYNFPSVQVFIELFIIFKLLNPLILFISLRITDVCYLKLLYRIYM